MLNLKDWKLCSQDGKMATLKHAKGHTMTIAMGAIPKIQREQIKRLAKVQQYADGSPDSVQSSDDNSNDSDNSAQNQPSNAPASNTTNNFFVGGAQPQPQPLPAAPPGQPLTPAPQSPAGSEFAKQINQQPASVSEPVPRTSSVLNENGQVNPAAVQQAGQAGAAGQQMVNAAAARAMVPVQEASLTAQGQANDRFQQAYNALQDETNKFGNDINGGKIDPNHYWSTPGLFGQKDTPKRLMAGIGLVLGGIGAGKLGSTDNAALRALNNAIDRDVNAQQQSFNNKHTMLGAYQQLFGNSVTATNMTKNAIGELVKNRADLIANQLGTPQAAAALETLKGNVANDQMGRSKASAFDITQAPGYRAAHEDTTMGMNNNPAAGNTKMAGQPQISGGMTTDDLKKLNAEQSEAGIPSESGSGETEQSPLDLSRQLKKETIEPILNPNAERAYEAALNYNVNAGKQTDQMKEQYKTAKLADAQLSQLNKNYADLIDLSQKGGVMGRVHRTFEPAEVPTGGGDLVSGLIRAGAQVVSKGSNTSTNRAYDAVKTDLLGSLTSILKGQVGDSTLHDIVNKVAPEYGDTAETLRKKYTVLVNFIKKHVPTDALHPFGITKQ